MWRWKNACYIRRLKNACYDINIASYIEIKKNAFNPEIKTSGTQNNYTSLVIKQFSLKRQYLFSLNRIYCCKIYCHREALYFDNDSVFDEKR